MSNDGSTHTVSHLSLEQIAAWQNISAGMTVPVVARVPSLQRGAVWKPGQIELLWDSILRGFPLGAFVVCEKLESQKSRPGKYDHSTAEAEQYVTHHLLDGQQRANGIALGFDDPFACDKEVSAVLWLDLKPSGIQNTTRSYLFRITTVAHPWGYAKNDETSTIPTNQMRAALQDCGWRNERDELVRPGRPKPNELWPQDATTPIPFAWLIGSADASGLQDAQAFWASIQACCRRQATGQPEKHWATRALAFLENDSDTAEQQRNHILSGLRHALALRVVVLHISKEVLMAATPQESANTPHTHTGDTRQENIAHVEHLFQRLNAGGSPLSGEELAYSMLKAYWPEVEAPIEKQAAQRMPASRLMMLGARVALTERADPTDTIQRPLSVSTLRRIALEDDVSTRREKERIRDFFLPGSSSLTTLDSVLQVVDAWLGSAHGDVGLPAVLHTSIARNSPDVYLLLMYLARYALHSHDDDPVVTIADTAQFCKPLLGLATVLHWFGEDKSRAVAAVYKKLGQAPLRPDVFRGLLQDMAAPSEGRILLYPIPPPEVLTSLIMLPTDEATLKDWAWWKLARGPAPERSERPEYSALQRLKAERELLLYAQRAYIQRQFRDYDPARQDLWEQHNRPWDFDHILASAKVYRKQGILAGVKEWVYCIANLRAWPMEDNRSDQAKPLIGNEGKLQDHLGDSFLEEAERDGFQKGYDGISVASNACTFITSAKHRLLRIYRAWYDALDIGVLTGK